MTSKAKVYMSIGRGMLDGGTEEALEGLETATASKTLMKQPAVLARPPFAKLARFG